jgi:glycerophosphoryl diester phosphodiesterase
MCRFLAYNTNAYVLRSSVSFDEASDICGASMIVSPKGSVLANMKSSFGMATAEFDPTDKYYKPAGYGNPDAAHHEYIEYGRKPWQYRISGPSVVPFDNLMKYPRMCAHRGFNTIAPENSMPAFGAAIALGAEEIEFDIWATKDDVIVSCHDSTLDRVSNGHGKIYEHSYEDLLQLDFGIKYSEKFKGLRIPTFENILRQFAGRVIMNIHVKFWDQNFPNPMIEEIVGLIRKYDAQNHAYFMTTNDRIIRQVMAFAPDIRCCVGWDGNKDPMSMVDRAIALGAYKIQLFKPYFNAETVKKAHEHGILCNVFWSDDPEETKAFREMGIDTILTNDYNLISQVVER